MMASLFDGRLAEQETRLRAARTQPNVWTAIIIEGAASERQFSGSENPSGRFHYFTKTYLQHVLRSEERALILRTASVEETAAVLLTHPLKS